MKKFCCWAAAWLATASCSALAQGTAFTYQGRLIDGGSPANGVYDLRFRIFDSGAGPTVVAGPLTNSAFAVSGGSFTVQPGAASRMLGVDATLTLLWNGADWIGLAFTNN